MYLSNCFLLSAIIGLATCVRVFDPPKLDGTENHIDRNMKSNRNNARSLWNTFRGTKRSQRLVPESVKSSKKADNKIAVEQANLRLERERSEEAEQKNFGSEQANGGLGAWLDELRSGRQLSSDGDRIQFQIQGHKGPRTYIFGFDTGHGKNRQFRLEEMSENGTVTGQYGYYDARGKLRTVEYVARPSGGYNERHHENNVS